MVKMKRGTVSLAAVLLLGCAVSGAETLLPADVVVRDAVVENEPHVDLLAQEVSGTIWGISRNQAGQIFLRRDKGWEATWVAGAESLRPQAICATADGAVVCLWLSGDGPQGALSRHHGADEPNVVPFEGRLREPQLSVCPDGSAIVTERGPVVVVFDAAGKTAQVQTLPDTLFRPAVRGDSQERNYAQTRALQDEAGCRWLWSYALDTGDYQWRIRGLVRMHEDGGVEPFAPAGLAPDDKVSDILPAGPNQLWLAKVGDGLWSVNTESGQTAALPEASFEGVQREAFSYIEEMREIDGVRYVVTCPRPTQFDAAGENSPRIAGRVSLSVRYFYDQRMRSGVLFRHRDGKWERVIDGLDESPRFGGWKRPWAHGADALFIGATGSGPWVVPKHASASLVLLDWQQRFPLADAADFSATAKGELLCVSSHGETALTSSWSNRPQRIRGVTTIKTWKRIWRDTRGHLWTCANPMHEWDGDNWIDHPLPAAVVGKSAWEWLSDDRDRGWILFDSGQVAICDFATAKWQVFETVESSLQAQLPAGVRLPNLDDPFLDPAYSSDGRCALFQLPDRLSYFDGAEWHHWTTREIAGESAQVNGRPYFDETGGLCFPLGGHVRQWNAQAGTWIAFSDPFAPEPSTRPVEPSVELAEPSPITDPASVACDADGHYWIVTRDGQLKKLAPGILVSAFFEGEPHPFRPGMKVARALIDPRGAAWLEVSELGPYHRYVYIQGTRPPDTSAELLRIEGDTAMLRFGLPIRDASQKKGAPSTSLFSWQLDGGRWQRLTRSPDLTLTRLAAGRHRLLARAYGPTLSVDPTPAVVEWKIDVDPEEQHRALLAELSAPTLARREAAAKALRAQGASALPFLKKARAASSEEVRWWIDAILQQTPPQP